MSTLESDRLGEHHLFELTNLDITCNLNRMHQLYNVTHLKQKLQNIREMSQLMRLWYLSHRRPANPIGDQRRLRRACASAQSRQSLRCSHTWSMEVNEGSRPNIRHLAPLDWLRMRVWRMSWQRTKSAIISWAGSNKLCVALIQYDPE